MDTIRNRAKDRFPMVLLTLLSIVQALALEFLWDHTRHRTEIFEISEVALLGWLQIVASLNIIIVIWLMYAGMLMRFRWTPTVSDSIWPFFVGLIQFLMIEIMGAEKLALWIIVLALIYGTTNFINHRAMKRARIDPANREFFDQYLPATLRDFAPQITMVTTLILAGSWIWFSGHHGWFAICTLVGSLIGLGYETHKAARYWNVSMENG
jgi:hypothetical protein